MNVLILEDEFLLAMMLAEELEEEGHIVLGPVSKVDDALKIAAETTPDLALLNINLGPNERGTDAATALVRDYGVPCLFVSGSEEIAKMHKDVAMGILAKPYTPVSIKAALAVAIRLVNGERVEVSPMGLTLYTHQLVRSAVRFETPTPSRC